MVTQVIQPKMQKPWQITKAINIGDVISVVVALVISITYINNIDKKVDTQEVKINNLQEQISMQREDTRMMLLEVKDSMRRIDEKLDRLIERRGD
jgi:cell division protein FtsL